MLWYLPLTSFDVFQHLNPHSKQIIAPIRWGDYLLNLLKKSGGKRGCGGYNKVKDTKLIRIITTLYNNKITAKNCGYFVINSFVYSKALPRAENAQ